MPAETSLLWDVETLGRIGDALPISGGYIRALAISRGIVAAGSEDGTVRFYDRYGKPALKSLVATDGSITALAMTRDVLAVIYNHRVLRRWKMPDCSPIGEPPQCDSLINAVAIGDGILALGCGDFSVRLLNTTTGQYRGSPLIGHNLFVRCVAIEKDLIVSGSSDGSVRVWDRGGAEPLGKADSDIERGQFSIAVTDDLAITAGREQLRSWDLTTGERKGFSEKCYRGRLDAPLVAGEGFIAYNGGPDSISIFHVKTGAVSSPKGDCRIAVSLAISQGLLVAVGADGALRRWNLETLEPLGDPVFLNLTGGALVIAGDVIWTAGWPLQCWDLRSGTALAKSEKIEDISSLATDGKVLVSGHWSGEVKVRDASRGASRRPACPLRHTRATTSSELRGRLQEFCHFR